MNNTIRVANIYRHILLSGVHLFFVQLRCTLSKMHMIFLVFVGCIMSTSSMNVGKYTSLPCITSPFIPFVH